jgi:predicted house-cleaning noncanonical NTP pyrophosphatase (MazG superfamily)
MKMTKNFKNLSESFNIDEDISINCELVKSNNDNISDLEKIENNNSTNANSDIKKDYEYTRGNLYSLIEKGQEAINGILELAQESEMPRAYEVAGQLIKNVADATDKLMELQKKLKDIEEDKQKGPTTVNNALFVGSTSELAKFLKQQTQNEDI